MAKIGNFILEYREQIKKAGINQKKSATPTKHVIIRFVSLFKTMDDVRVQAMIDYPLVELILIAFLAVLANASTWNDIEDFGQENKKWLKKFIKLKNGVPSHDTFRRVFSLIDPEQFERVTVAALMENLNAIKKSFDYTAKETSFRQICVDGKEERGTGRKYGTEEEVKNLQTLHVYDATNEICLFSRPIDSKTNEIPVAQDILKTLNLKECIVTFDALHTQKTTVSIIASQKGFYIGGLKANQETLFNTAIDAFSKEEKEKIKSTKNYYEIKEKAHNQIETRRYYMKKADRMAFPAIEWSHLKNYICVEKHIYNLKTKKESVEVFYYITNLNDIVLCADAIRGHWAVENKLHWQLDFSFGEDFNTTMDKKAFLNLSILNKMTLNLCTLAKLLFKNASIRRIRKKIGWNPDNLSIILNYFDDETIKAAIENIGKK